MVPKRKAKCSPVSNRRPITRSRKMLEKLGNLEQRPFGMMYTLCERRLCPCIWSLSEEVIKTVGEIILNYELTSKQRQLQTFD